MHQLHLQLARFSFSLRSWQEQQHQLRRYVCVYCPSVVHMTEMTCPPKFGLKLVQ